MYDINSLVMGLEKIFLASLDGIWISIDQKALPGGSRQASEPEQREATLAS
jgi:hypothetical protein